MSEAKRMKNENWLINTESGGHYSYPAAQLAVLMDIRDELQTLNGLLRCPNFLAIPAILKTIKSNTAKKKRK